MGAPSFPALESPRRNTVKSQCTLAILLNTNRELGSSSFTKSSRSPCKSEIMPDSQGPWGLVRL